MQSSWTQVYRCTLHSLILRLRPLFYTSRCSARTSYLEVAQIILNCTETSTRYQYIILLEQATEHSPLNTLNSTILLRLMYCKSLQQSVQSLVEADRLHLYNRWPWGVLGQKKFEIKTFFFEFIFPTGNAGSFSQQVYKYYRLHRYMNTVHRFNMYMDTIGFIYDIYIYDYYSCTITIAVQVVRYQICTGRRYLIKTCIKPTLQVGILVKQIYRKILNQDVM